MQLVINVATSKSMNSISTERKNEMKQKKMLYRITFAFVQWMGTKARSVAWWQQLINIMKWNAVWMFWIILCWLGLTCALCLGRWNIPLYLIGSKIWSPIKCQNLLKIITTVILLEMYHCWHQTILIVIVMKILLSM